MTYYQYPDSSVYNYSFTPCNSEAIKLSNAIGKIARQRYCILELKKLIKPGTTVYTIPRSIARSGMSMLIDVVIIKRNKMQNISNYVADAAGYTQHKSGALKAGGYGMDQGLDIIYNLGSCIWPKGTRKPHGTRNGQPDHDGGYAFNQEWL